MDMSFMWLTPRAAQRAVSTLLLVYALLWLYQCPDATVQASTTSPPSTASAPAAFLWSDTDLDSQGPGTTSGQSPFLTALPATAGAIMLTWAGIALVLVGLGLGLAWWLGVRRVTSDTLLQAFW